MVGFILIELNFAWAITMIPDGWEMGGLLSKPKNAAASFL
jgi:hypothetical protein